MHARETFGHVRVEHAVFVPAPRRLRLRSGAGDFQFFKTAKEDFPHVTVSWRERAPTSQPLHPRPGKSQFYSPALVHARAVVERAVNIDGAAQAREIPIQKRPARAAWMRPPPEMLTVAIIVAGEG